MPARSPGRDSSESAEVTAVPPAEPAGSLSRVVHPRSLAVEPRSNGRRYPILGNLVQLAGALVRPRPPRRTRMTGAQGVNAMNGAAPDASPKGAYRWNLGRRVRARRCVGQPGRGWQMVRGCRGRADSTGLTIGPHSGRAGDRWRC